MKNYLIPSRPFMVAFICTGLFAKLVSFVDLTGVDPMKNRDKCCLYAFIAVITVLLSIGSFWGYGLADRGLLSWLGAVVIIVTVLVCATCKRVDR